MKRWAPWATLPDRLLPVLALAAALNSHAAPPPVEAFFRSPAFSAARLAPDGQSLALLVQAQNRPTWLSVLDMASMKITPVASFEDLPIGHAEWVNDRRLVFSMNPPLVGFNTVEVGPGLFGVDADGENLMQLVETNSRGTRYGNTRVRLPWGTRLHAVNAPQMGDEVLVSRPSEVSRERVGYWSLTRLDTRTGRTSEVEVPLHSESWVFDAQGRLRAAQVRQGAQVQLLWRDLPAPGSPEDPQAGWRTLNRRNAYDVSDSFNVRHIDAAGQVYVSAGQGDKAALYTLDPSTGQPHTPALLASPDFDLYPLFITDSSGRLQGLRYTIDAEVTQWLDPAAQALQTTIDALLPATTNRLTLPRRGDAPWVLVQAYADVQPMLTLLYNRSTKKLLKVGASLPDIDPKAMGQTDFVKLKARDGHLLPAWLTLPPGGRKTQLPMVVLVHGGPWVRGMSWRWDPEVQFLASRGYAVLQPEFRGSTGYGGQHYKAGFKEWGRAMQTDIADATRWAIAQGTADPQRICIAGGSYGGYAALMGLAQDPDLFRCGVAWAAVTDIDLMYGAHWSDFRGEYKREGMPLLIGDRVADAAALKAASPVHNAERIRQPLLLAHGSWDVRVPIAHGEALRDALKPHNAKVEWRVYDDEGHGWGKPANNIDFWGRVERFLARHIGTP
jgi:acetyl esterase/lipase